MTTIQLSFPWGRFYATPWGINASRLREPEWPPSPWRLLRALVSAWFRAHPGQVPSADCIALIETLGRELPHIGIGKVSFGHTVHWQPNYGAAGTEDKADATYKNTRHENHFAAVSGAVFFRWPTVDLALEVRRTLETLLAELSYFGRAESLCYAEICDTEQTSDKTGWCRSTGGRKISASCRDVFCPNPTNFRFTDLWSRRSPEIAPDSPAAPPHLVDTLLSSDMKADGAAWFSYQMPDGWPQQWVVRTPRITRPANKPAPSAGAKTAHYLCFSLQCRVPLLPKFIVPLSEKFRDEASRHLRNVHGKDAPSFAFFGHPDHRPADAVGDHQHAFYLPMSGKDDASGFLSDMHIWCPYGFTQLEVEILLRIDRLDWGSGKYPVRPVLTALAKEPPADAPFSIGKTASQLWRSASPFVPPRYFYRRDGNRLSLKTKDQPEFQLIECLRALGIETAGEVRRISLGSQQTATGQTLWDIVRTPVEEEEHFRDATNVSVHRPGSSATRGRERRVGVFFDVEFKEPVALRVPALGHSSHFGLGLFLPIMNSGAAKLNECVSNESIRNRSRL